MVSDRRKQAKHGEGIVDPVKATPDRSHHLRMRKTTLAVDAQVETLRENPGEWMIVREACSTQHGFGPYRNRGCQTSVQRQLDGTYTVYARWPE